MTAFKTKQAGSDTIPAAMNSYSMLQNCHAGPFLCKKEGCMLHTPAAKTAAGPNSQWHVATAAARRRQQPLVPGPRTRTANATAHSTAHFNNSSSQRSLSTAAPVIAPAPQLSSCAASGNHGQYAGTCFSTVPVNATVQTAQCSEAGHQAR